MSLKPRLGRLVPLDDHDAEYAESYDASGQAAAPSDWSARYDYRETSDAALDQAERWTRYYVESGMRRSEIHRLRAIHQEQERRRREGQS